MCTYACRLLDYVQFQSVCLLRNAANYEFSNIATDDLNQQALFIGTYSQPNARNQCSMHNSHYLHNDCSHGLHHMTSHDVTLHHHLKTMPSSVPSIASLALSTGLVLYRGRQFHTGTFQNSNQNMKSESGMEGSSPNSHQPNALTHFDEAGRPKMVAVGDKSITKRTATACGRILIGQEAFELVATPTNNRKGDVLSVSQLAGIMGAKQTAILIPLCHNIPLDAVHVNLKLDPTNQSVVVTATVECTGKTGVEMEAMTAVSIATLTVYDMVKAVARGAVIQEIRLVRKTGGLSGTFEQ